MVRVDGVGMRMSQGLVPVRVCVWLRPLPAFVFVLVVLVVDMQMIMLDFAVDMFQRCRIVGGPHDERGYRRQAREHTKHAERGSKPE